MPTELIGLLGIGVLLLLIVLRAPIGLALLFVGLGGTGILHGIATVEFIAATVPTEVLTSETLSVLPLFLLMGSFALHSGIARDLYAAANAFIGHRRGGLAAGTIIACGGFGAICGSSLATVTTMARISVPEMLRYNYSPRIAAGSVAAGGTLGILIPPSLLMILYAYLTETSVGRLFAAGIVPGLVAISLYCLAIVVWVSVRPEVAPAQQRATVTERLSAVRATLGVLLVFIIVMGGIFAGLFSPTEGAGIGATAMLVLSVLMRKMTFRGFLNSFLDTLTITAMIFLIVIGIETFNYFMEATRLPDAIVTFFTTLDSPPIIVLIGIVILLMLMGCILDSIAIVMIMTPFLYPIVLDLGYDLIWFGVIMVMVVEIGLMTPPFGINVFVINSLVPQINLKEAFLGVLPFILADVVRLALLIAFPAIALWLPTLMFQ